MGAEWKRIWEYVVPDAYLFICINQKLLDVTFVFDKNQTPKSLNSHQSGMSITLTFYFHQNTETMI